MGNGELIGARASLSLSLFLSSCLYCAMSLTHATREWCFIGTIIVVVVVVVVVVLEFSGCS